MPNLTLLSILALTCYQRRDVTQHVEPFELTDLRVRLRAHAR